MPSIFPFDATKIHRHLWDVIAGASVGVGATNLFTTPYPKNHFDIGFVSGNQTYTILFNYRFLFDIK